MKKSNIQKPLTIREHKVVHNLLAGMTKKDSLVSAGYAESTANTQASAVLGKPRVIQAIQELMDEMGISDRKLLAVVNAGLDATKVISAMVIARGPEEGEPGEEMAPANSMTKDFVEVPDFKERREAATLGLKLRGHLGSDKKDEGNQGRETYEQIRERLGLNRLPLKEAMREYFRNFAIEGIKKKRLEEAKEKEANNES